MLSREAVIGLAVVGGILSLGAMILGSSAEPARRRWGQVLNRMSYGAMGASIVLFIIAGLRAPAAP